VHPEKCSEWILAMADMTPTQARYLAFIHAYTVGFGLPPAETEIAEAMDVSPPSVSNDEDARKEGTHSTATGCRTVQQ
jgi:hypothetical protein